jgi:hypothetical protein
MTAAIAPDRQAPGDQDRPLEAIVARSEGTILPLGASWIEAFTGMVLRLEKP